MTSTTRALFVKLSSLGDVIHNLPAVTDLGANRPDVRIEWAVEEAYADLVGLHPSVACAIPVGMRRLRASLLSGEAWHAIGEARRTLRREPYDFIVDTQGLLKSALVARSARGVAFGFDRQSARETLAARFYDQPIRVERALHAVERNRRLTAQVFGYALENDARYGLAAPASPPPWAPERYFVALHATSRGDKRWPETHWTELARRLAQFGVAAVYPSGSVRERETAELLASGSPGGIVAPAMSLVEAAALLAGAQAVVGVDTGLTHLAVALERLTVGIYVATDPALTGLHGGAHAVNLGGPGRIPTVDEVETALGYVDGAA